LPLLEEPKDVKERVRVLISQSKGSGESMDRIPLFVWYGNLVPKYLWSAWKILLEKKGFTWQKFLRLMKFRTDDTLLWVENKISWEEFLARIESSAIGRLGEVVKGRK